jgi:uncharacterized repeat protein (TIGR03803 family)
MTLSCVIRSLGAGVAVALLGACAANPANPVAPAGSLDWRMRPPAAGLQDIYNFEGSPNGKLPGASMTFQTKNAWPITTTTAGGGDSNNDGTVVGFRQKSGGGKWSESVLYAFKGGSYGDGSQPTSGVINVSLPGSGGGVTTTAAGGTNNNGTFVAFDTSGSGSWKESFLYSFGGTPDGANPWGSVVADTAGNLYGTTTAGGAYYSGTVYRMQPKSSSFTESVLYSFGAVPYDGSDPLGGLSIDKAGALYGTTELGGSANAGTVFKLTPLKSGYTESILHSFQGAPDGANVQAGLTAALEHARDYLYGTTVYGGANNDGTVYKLTSSGSGYTVLWNFGSVSGDGIYPIGGVCVSKKGVIYGTTLAGGSGASSGLGTFFTLTPSGKSFTESVYSFTGANGAYPRAAPSFYSKGNNSKGVWLVTASAGGTGNMGAVSDSVKSSNWSGYCSN